MPRNVVDEAVEAGRGAVVHGVGRASRSPRPGTNASDGSRDVVMRGVAHAHMAQCGTCSLATSPRTRSLASLSPHGFHRVAYYEWGDPANDRVVICAHGLSRNGRDFDVLGEALAATHRVLAVDMPGRGASQWLADPNDYVFPTYLTTLTALVARSSANAGSWVGTSMGALLGMVMAAQPNTPVVPAGGQRCGTADRACRDRAHPRLPGARADLRDVGRGGRLHPHRCRRPSAR